jgi:two-component system, cell cycle sensor histidine kinase and response regulator CckA
MGLVYGKLYYTILDSHIEGSCLYMTTNADLSVPQQQFRGIYFDFIVIQVKLNIWQFEPLVKSGLYRCLSINARKPMKEKNPEDKSVTSAAKPVADRNESQNDYTDRNRRNLRERDSLLRSITRNMPAIIFQGYVSDSGKLGVSYASDNLFRVFGLPADKDNIFDLFVSHVHKEDQDRLLATIRSAVEATGAWNFEGRFVKPSGEQLWFQGLSMPRKEHGRLIYDGILLDITERKKMEQALRESEARLKDAQRMAKIGSWDHDLVSDRFYWSDEMFRIFEIAPENLSYETMLAAVHPEDRNKFEAALKEGLINRTHIINYNRLQMPDGRIKYIAAQGQAVFSAEGNPMRLYGTAQDVTESKKVEEALLKSEERYRSLFEDAIEGIYQTTLNGRYIILNSSMARMLGYDSIQDALDKITDIGTQVYADPEERKALIVDLVRDGRITGREVLFKRRDGVKLKVLLNARLAYDKNGAPEHIEGSCIDMTDKWLAEEELRKLASVVTHSSELINLANLDGKMIFLNDAGSRMLGIEPDRINELQIEQVIPDHLIPVVRTELLPALIKTGAWEGELQYKNLKTGKLTDVYALAFAILDPTNKAPLYLANVSRDITENKLSDQALREAESRYRMLFDHAPYGIVIMDPETIAIIDVNETVCRQFGYSREELLKLDVTNIEIDGSPENKRERMQKAIRNGRNAFETQIRSRQGDIRTIEVAMQMTEISGRPLCYCAISDITEHRRLMDQLRHSQKLEGLGQLAGGIAHDFNNVLNVVIGFTELIKMKMREDDPARHYADEIMNAGMRGAALTRQILAFSRKQALDMKPVNINNIIVNLQKMLRRLVREDISIHLNLADRDLIVMADAGQIEQALMNLATNACDAMPNGGSITIATGPFIMDDKFVETHGFGRPDNYALINFSDTGCGMDNETRLHIFEPFYTTKQPGKGTGLGLAAVYGIVNQHGGHINVYSEEGRGTNFKLYLPLTLTSTEKIEKVKPSELKGGTETILIAEDEETLRMLTKTVLTNYGYNVIEAVDGEDAIAKYAENRDAIRLVILDAIMPNKNGFEAFEAIRGLRPEIKAVFMSGYTDGSVNINELSDKGAAFLQKPVKPADLLRTVRETLDEG